MEEGEVMANRKRQPEDGPYVRPWKRRPCLPELQRLQKKRKWLRNMIGYHEAMGNKDFQWRSWQSELAAVEARIEYLEGKE